jgi:polysaccharide biosynthesis/export protein
LSRSSYLNKTLAATAIGLLAGCSTMPAFGPDGSAITGTAPKRTAMVKDALPFEVIEVTAATLPAAANTISFFPASFRSQLYSSADEIVAEGDHLEIRIWEVAEDGLFATSGERETILNVKVSNSGQITVPYAGTFEARGLTTTEMRALLLERYQGRAVEPEISVSISSTDAKSTTLLGAVRTPGRITLPSRGFRLLDLIAEGGGVSHATWEILILVQRGSISGVVRLSDIVGNPANNIVILPGDTINVAHEPRRFAVYGGVSRSSNIEIPSQNATLAYLLAEVGGLNDRVAQARSVFVFRRGSSGATPTAYKFDFSQPDVFFLSGTFRLEPTDIIYVAPAGAANLNRLVSIFLSPLASFTSTLRN